MKIMEKLNNNSHSSHNGQSIEKKVDREKYTFYYKVEKNKI